MSPDTRSCPLCGAVAAATLAGCSAACPLAGACGSLACCAACGYRFPDLRRGLAGWLARWLARPAPAAGEARPEPVRRTLADAPRGARLRLTRLGALRPDLAERLAVLGMRPGAGLRVIRAGLSPVIEVGATSLALDAEVARQVEVTAAVDPAPVRTPLRPLVEESGRI